MSELQQGMAYEFELCRKENEELRSQLAAQSRELAILHDACKLYSKSAQSWHGLVDVLQMHPGRRDDESAPAFAERLIGEQARELAELRKERDERATRDEEVAKRWAEQEGKARAAAIERTEQQLEALEKLARGVAELDATLSRTREELAAKDAELARLRSELTFAAELLGTAEPTNKACNGETAVDLLRRLARDDSAVVREGAQIGLESLDRSQPAQAEQDKTGGGR